MKKISNITGLFKKLRDKYRLSIYRDESYEEVLNFRLSRFNLLAWGGIFLIILTVAIFSLIAFTDLIELVPGITDEEIKKTSIENVKQLQELEKQLSALEEYNEMLRRHLTGEPSRNFDNIGDTLLTYDSVNIEPSRSELEFRANHENRNRFGVKSQKPITTTRGISEIYFFPPVSGHITNSFDPASNHYGTDVVNTQSEIVKATLPGTVIMASWTLETGWVIEIQHEHNLISVYKHNAELLKNVGDYVNLGEAIAIIGNSGELTTGTHLHFELWFNGAPLDPEEYISF
ncbi:MAG: M23 family metallopeptidase [Bacteroidales bacterium]|nr:M23 family metallopeptidase [Bacteroidales bacterium]